MSAWTGLCQLFTDWSIPHQTKIIRKPQGVGAEIKAIADGESGILLGLDIMEEKEAMREKEYVAEWGAGTAVCLRLMQPYAEQQKILIANSAFSSVKTLIALWTIMGTYFMGAVKTASAQFSKKWLCDWFTKCTENNVGRGHW